MTSILRRLAAAPFVGLGIAFLQMARLMLAIAKPILPESATPLPAWLHALDGELAEEGVD